MLLLLLLREAGLRRGLWAEERQEARERRRAGAVSVVSGESSGRRMARTVSACGTGRDSAVVVMCW